MNEDRQTDGRGKSRMIDGEINDDRQTDKRGERKKLDVKIDDKRKKDECEKLDSLIVRFIIKGRWTKGKSQKNRW